MAYDISVFKCIWCLDGVGVILSQPAGIKAWSDTQDFLQKCFNIEHTASAVFVATEKGRILYTYTIVFTNF